MLQSRFVVWMLSVGLMVPGMGVVYGQEYPNKPIRMVALLSGGSSDTQARLIGQGISGPLGQPVVVDNRASVVIQADVVSKAPPDGYTILITGADLWRGPLLVKMPYDPKDFLPITTVTKEPNILVVHPSLPVKSVKELIALAKAKPGELNYGSSGTGGTPHLAGALFNVMAGVNIVRIPYKNTPFIVTELLGGEGKTVHMAFLGLNVVAPHMKSGKMRALAVTSAEPYALSPDLPTVAASGLPGFELTALDSILVAAKTPQPIINRLNQEIVRVLRAPDVKEKFLAVGMVTVGSSPEEVMAAMKADVEKISKVIKDAGIKAD